MRIYLTYRIEGYFEFVFGDLQVCFTCADASELNGLELSSAIHLADTDRKGLTSLSIVTIGPLSDNRPLTATVGVGDSLNNEYSPPFQVSSQTFTHPPMLYDWQWVRLWRKALTKVMVVSDGKLAMQYL